MMVEQFSSSLQWNTEAGPLALGIEILASISLEHRHSLFSLSLAQHPTA